MNDRDEISELRRDLRAVEQERDEARAAWKEAMATIGWRDEQIKRLRADLDEARSKIATAERERDDLRGELCRVRGSRDEACAELDASEREREAVDQERDAQLVRFVASLAVEAREELVAKLATAERERDEVRAALAIAERKREAWFKFAEEIRARLATAERERNEARERAKLAEKEPIHGVTCDECGGQCRFKGLRV